MTINDKDKIDFQEAIDYEWVEELSKDHSQEEVQRAVQATLAMTMLYNRVVEDEEVDKKED